MMLLTHARSRLTGSCREFIRNFPKSKLRRKQDVRAMATSGDVNTEPQTKCVRLSSVQGDGTPSNEAKFIKEETLATGKWLSLSQITYQDKTGRVRTWESLSRTTRAETGVDAVTILPILKRSLKYDCVICIKQYRPPVRAYTLEFPAGLIDAGESIEEAAVRELKEETGFSAQIKHTSPATCLDPGTESCTMVIATAEIDGDLHENKKPKQNLDESEAIEVLTIPLHELMGRLNSLADGGVIVDARVYSYGIALSQATKQSTCQPDLK